VPPLSELEHALDEVQAALSNFENTEAAVVVEIRRAEAVSQAILKAAFAGKLVPQDPNDEPASVLLARIRAERAAKPRPARGRRSVGRRKRREDQLALGFDGGDAA
jgi:type I restriction enzyme S subunit